MRVMVTGGAGFIGTHLRKRLKHSGDDVLIFDRERVDSASKYGGLYVRGDVTDYLSLSRAFKSFEPDVVVHLAGMVSRKECEETPQNALMTNALGTQNVCYLALEHGARVVYAGSSEEYGHSFNSKKRVTETTPLGAATGIYSLTKRMADEIVHHFASKRGLKATTLRFFMLYGPGEPFNEYRSAMVRFINQAIRGEPLTVHKDTSRSWCYVYDAVQAIYLILNRDQRRNYEVFNIGRHEPIETIDLAHLIVQMTNSQSQIIEVQPESTIIAHKNASFRKIRDAVDWESRISLDLGLKMTIRHYLAKEGGR